MGSRADVQKKRHLAAEQYRPDVAAARAEWRQGVAPDGERGHRRPNANVLDSLKYAQRKIGQSKARRTQAAFAAHLRQVARVYPAARHERVVLVIEKAPCHRGKVINEALAENPHLEFHRLPSYSPCLNPIE